MAEAAATAVPGKIPTLLGKVREVGVPDKATVEWLKTIGLRSSNDRSLLPALRQIDFIGADGKPTQRWRDYRGGDHKRVLGQAIRDGYPKLYETYADAHTRGNTDLSHIFSGQSNAGKQTIDRMVSTFKALAALAEFDGLPASTSADAVTPDSSILQVIDTAHPISPGRASGSVVVNVNIQLTLPETSDSKVALRRIL